MASRALRVRWMRWMSWCGPIRPMGAPRSGGTARDGDPVHLADQAAVEAEDSIGGLEVVLIVADDQQRLAPGLQLGQELAVEESPRAGVLMGGPLVEDADGAVLQAG